MNEPDEIHPTIGDSYSTGDAAEAIFREWARQENWLPRKQQPDFFIDYLVEIVQTREPTGRIFAAQVKGVALFGDEASHIASSCLDDEYRNQWVSRLLKHLVRDAQDLDSTQKHRERISYLLEALQKQNWKGDDASWGLVFDLLALAAELLGYEGIKGHRSYTPLYWQDLQTHLDIGNERGQCEQLMQEFQSAAARRVQVVRYLKEQGLSDFEVAMTLKTSEHEVEKLNKCVSRAVTPSSSEPA